MTGSTVRHSDATRGGNVAAPHASIDGCVRPVQPFDSDNTNPAGGINSNAEDMAKWMITYRDAWYGDIIIGAQDDKLVMKFTKTPSLVGDLEHWQYDTFVVRWRDRELRADAFVTFSLTPDGAIDQAKMAAVSPATDFSFDFQDLLLKPVK